jgi:hypothetical protein
MFSREEVDLQARVRSPLTWVASAEDNKADEAD